MSQPTLTPAEFAKKWRGVTTTEKASSQSHFIDLCRMLGEPTPHDADPTGEQYAFEKYVAKAGGGEGFADVWKRDFFAWEYKGKYKDLKAAYVQLLSYKDGLDNPPLLIVSDLDRIEIRTNFEKLSRVLTTITLDDLAADDPSKPLSQLRDVFTAPDAFRPQIQAAQITEQAARHFAELAQALRARGNDPEAVAHFLDRILFCLFAEDASLLPKGIFSRLSQASKGRSDIFTFADAVGRYRHEVKTMNLTSERVWIVEEQDIATLSAGMTKSSSWIRGHDQPVAVNRPVPPPDELRDDLDALRRWDSDLRRRRARPAVA